jgi:hypothetical protein
MKPPGIGIRVSRPVFHEDGSEPTPMAFQDVEISGNRAGLLDLAERIRKVAESTVDGYHLHLWPGDESPLLRSKDYGITVSLNSVK